MNKLIKHFLSLILLVSCLATSCQLPSNQLAAIKGEVHATIEGEVDVTIEGEVHGCQGQQDHVPEVVLEEGIYRGFARDDGKFTIHGVAKGSYVATVNCPWQEYESLRVEVSSNRTVRARRLNYLLFPEVRLVKYPLEFQPIKKRESFRFEKRQSFRFFLLFATILN